MRANLFVSVPLISDVVIRAKGTTNLEQLHPDVVDLLTFIIQTVSQPHHRLPLQHSKGSNLGRALNPLNYIHIKAGSKQLKEYQRQDSEEH